jgi:hypothetical protein
MPRRDGKGRRRSPRPQPPTKLSHLQCTAPEAQRRWRIAADDVAVSFGRVSTAQRRKTVPGGGVPLPGPAPQPSKGAPRRRLQLLLALVLATAGGVLVTQGIEPAPTVSDVPAPDSLRGRAARVDSYLVHYGQWNDQAVAEARRHPLVIAHPSAGRLTRDVVARIQGAGAEGKPSPDHTIALCYISIGEDLRTSYLSDDEARADPRLKGDGSGPRVDPRGPGGNGKALAGIDPKGAPSPGGAGFASFYLDDNSVSRTGTGDGFPDRNPVSRSFYVNAGDPKWFDLLDGMTLDSPDAVAGFREILTTDHGRGLGCDGVFLDTVDTAAPNRYTERENPSATRFEWTAPGVSKLVTRLRAAYPDKVILQNRGLFYFDPRQPQYAFTTRGPIDLLLFESYRLDASATHEFDPYIHADNRYNVAPKLMAEANRPDGFRVLSLGYAEGPPDRISHDTLRGTSRLGTETLLEDIRVAHAAGFRHALSDSGVSIVNSFVRDHAGLSDTTPPTWTSTTNDRSPGWPALPQEPTPRVGVQEVVAGKGKLTVRWDVALDLHHVGYAIYLQTLPFDFDGDPGLNGARRVVPTPAVPAGYRAGEPGSVAHEATITGLESGRPYYVVVRAFDDSPGRNEDRNKVVGFGRPT